MERITARIINVLCVCVLVLMAVNIAGCGWTESKGYTQDWLYPSEVKTVYVEMFDSHSFRRDHEYVLTDAVAKRLEAQTPYKIVSDRDVADTLLSGYIMSVGKGVLAGERNTGKPLEYEVYAKVKVSWKNLKTGDMLINNQEVVGSASYSKFNGQTFDYAADIAVNRSAERIIELMETPW